MLVDLQTHNLKMIQDQDKYCFTNDATNLANFVQMFCGAKVCEFGAGTGIISLLLASKVDFDCKITAIEIQKDSFELLNQNIISNNLQNCIEAKNQDILQQKGGEFDIIVCNPPYFKKDSAPQSPNQNIANSKCENLITISQIVEVAYKNLKDGGKFYVCFPQSRFVEILTLCSKQKLEPKLICPVCKDNKSAPHTFLIMAKKGANSGCNFADPIILA